MFFVIAVLTGKKTHKIPFNITNITMATIKFTGIEVDVPDMEGSSPVKAAKIPINTPESNINRFSATRILVI
jgi:hypothetical protein